MKLAQVFILSTVTNGTNINKNANSLSTQIKRQIKGKWAEENLNGKFSARAPIDGEKGFRALGAMMAFMQGNNGVNLEEALAKLEERYTNYGCYCWIDGTAGGVTGGGRVKDVSDHHCKELYRCYKCVNIDYSKNYTDVSYRVDTIENEDGSRSLDCSANSKQDAENICECDARFAMNIAKTEEDCANDIGPDPMYGEHCMDDQYRTTNGGGSFNPRKQCDKQFHGHEKDQCCGRYPNRYPYDENFKECCQTGAEGLEVFGLVSRGDCDAKGGRVVVSAAGDPNSYVFV